MEGLVDSSALFAVSGHREAAHLVYLGLHAQQHRGSAGVGLAVSDGHLIRYRRGAGLVQEALDGPSLQSLPGVLAVGQVWGRAEPTAPPELEVLETDRMMFARHRGGQLAAAVCGRFTNGARLRRELKEGGALFHTPSDAELLLHLVAQSNQKTFVNKLVDALWKLEGSYALAVSCEDRVVAVRDPSGFRPLVLGKLGEAALIASEDTAIRFVGGEVRREIRPGELVILDGRIQQSISPFPKKDPARCVQEWISVARPDAEVFGRSCHRTRTELGERLAKEAPCAEGEVVIGVPGSGEPFAVGYARASHLPYEAGLLREPYTARRFEEPPSGLRDLGTRLQWRAVPSVVQDRAVVLLSPSLVTGRALRKAVRLVLEAGARAVHVRVASPPVRAACYYGVSSPTVDELLLSSHATDAAEWLGARSVGFLSLEALEQVVVLADESPRGLCNGCLTGARPLEPEEPDDQLPLF